MDAVARFSPFGAEHVIRFDWQVGMSLSAIVRRAVEAMEKACGQPGSFQWFLDVGIVRVGGRAYDRALWPHAKPKAGMIVDLVPPHPGKGNAGKIGLILASIALTVATAGIAGGALATFGFGAAFGAGTLGANLAAAGVSLIGGLAIKALTPAATLGGGDSVGSQAAQRELSISGIAGNPLTRGDYLPSVIGRMRVSPPMLIPPFVTLERDTQWVHAMVGINGNATVESIKINGIDALSFDKAVIEVVQGDGSTPDTFLSLKTIRKAAEPFTMSEFKIQTDDVNGKLLEDQNVPANSTPSWHRVTKRAAAQSVTVRVAFPGGIRKQDGTACGIPLRTRFRKKGDVAWRNGPVLHIADAQLKGAFQCDLTFAWTHQKPPTDRLAVGWGFRYNVQTCWSRTGNGQSFQWNADPYFQLDINTYTNYLPVFTGYTNGGHTISASINTAGFEGWKAADNNAGTYWEFTSASTPQWWQIHWGAGNGKNLSSARLVATLDDFSALLVEVYGSHDGATWQLLGTNTLGQNIRDSAAGLTVVAERYSVQLDVFESFEYHRLVVVTGNAFVRIANIVLSPRDAPINSVASISPSNWNADEKRTMVVGQRASHNVVTTHEGATLYLTPNEWPDGEYDVEFKRGWTYEVSLFQPVNSLDGNYLYNAGAANAKFFDYSVASGQSTVFGAQLGLQAKMEVTSVFEEVPERPIRADVESRLTRICVRAAGLQISSISALFTAHAREYAGGVWGDAPVPTRNPIAYYRDALLLPDRSAAPLPGEVLDEFSLETAYDYADANGFTCDAVVQGRGMTEVLQLLASSMRASPRQSNMWGLVIDRDRSAETPSAMLTPQTSRYLGCKINFERIPHALRVTYSDADQDYEEREIIVYRDGFSAGTATDIRTLEDRSATTEAAATASAVYNLRQMYWRNRSYVYEVGFEGRCYGRGDLIAVADETWQRDSYFGLVKAVTVSLGLITSFAIYGVAELSKSASEFSMSDDVDAVTDVNGFGGQFGIMVRDVNGQVVQFAITETTDTSTLTLVTPVADVGQFGTDQPIAIGPLTREVRRLILHEKSNVGEEVWRLALLPEAPEIFL